MLEKVGACGLSITHRISRQKVETPEDISFPQLKLCGSSSRSYQLWFTTVHCRVGGQDLQSTKPAGRNSCWNSQNSVFFPDIQHPLCFQWEFLSLVLIACSPQPSPHPCFSAFDFTVPPLLFAMFLSPSLLLVLDLVLREPSSLPEVLQLHQHKFCWSSSPCYSPSLPTPPAHPLLTKSSGHFPSSQAKHLAQPRPVLNLAAGTSTE